MIQELEIFKDVGLSEEEERRIGEIPHKVLLESAFRALTGEIDVDGNTARLEFLRVEHARVLASFWRHRYLGHRATGQGREGESLDLAFVRGVCDESVLIMNRQTSTEIDEVKIAIDTHGEVDNVYAPTIISKIKTDLDESPDITYKVILKIGSRRFLEEDGSLRIAEFTRERVHEDPEHQRSWVYDTRTIR